MKKSIAILLVVTLSACSNLSISNTPQPSITFPVTNTSIPLPQTTLNNVYNNSKYGYSISYPDTYNVTIVSDDYVEIGSKITVEVMTVDPTAPRGDDGSIPGTKCFLHDIKKTR